MGVRFVEPVFRESAARIGRYVDETLISLQVDLDVPLSVLPGTPPRASRRTFSRGRIVRACTYFRTCSTCPTTVPG
jgi:hypothetical protein